MPSVNVKCPKCRSEVVIKRGWINRKKQRFLCKNPECDQQSFLLDYTYQAYCPGVKEQMVDMAINASGIRDTARVLNVSKDTVISTLKNQENRLTHINTHALNAMQNGSVMIEKYQEVEGDEMWSYVQKKKSQRWLWWAIDHQTGTPLAYVFGRRKDVVFKKLKQLLKPFSIQHFYTDDWGAYSRNLDPKHHTISKKNTQTIERKHLDLRTRVKRLTRKTICFSKTNSMHDLVIGLFINRVQFHMIK